MALEAADFEKLGSFIASEIEKKFEGVRQTAATQDRTATVGQPDVPADAGPEFYIHLANGDVVKSHDSSSTHIAAEDGSTQQVIGRYQVGD
jgi:hypothetical protein